MKSKKIISLILTAIMVLSIFPMQLMTGWAADEGNPEIVVTISEKIESKKDISLNFKDDKELVSYYFGTKSSQSSIEAANEFVAFEGESAKEKTESKTVTEAGTYYAFVKDNEGNVTKEGPYIFYKVTFDKNDSDYPDDAKAVCNVEKYILNAQNSEAFNFPAANIGDNNLEKWVDGEGNEYPVGQLFAATKSISFSAKWEDKPYFTDVAVSEDAYSSSQTVSGTMGDKTGLRYYAWKNITVDGEIKASDYEVISGKSFVKSLKATKAGEYRLVIINILGKSESYSYNFVGTELKADEADTRVIAGGAGDNSESTYKTVGNVYTDFTILTYKGKSFELPAVNVSPNHDERIGVCNWYDEDGKAYAVGQDYEPATDKTLTPKITQKRPIATYTVTKNAATQQKLTITVKYDAGIESYWFDTRDSELSDALKDANGNDELVIEQEVNNSETWYLRVKGVDKKESELYTYKFVKVALDLNTEDKTAKEPIEYVIAMADELVMLPEATAQYHSIVGWCEDKDGIGKVYKANNDNDMYTPTDDIKLYAIWNKVVSVDVDPVFTALTDSKKLDEYNRPVYTFYKGEEMDYTGMKVYATFSDGDQKEIAKSDYEVKVVDNNGDNALDASGKIATVGYLTTNVKFEDVTNNTQKFNSHYKATFTVDGTLLDTIPFCKNNAGELELGYRIDDVFAPIATPDVPERKFMAAGWYVKDKDGKYYEYALEEKTLDVQADYFAYTTLQVFPTEKYSEEILAGDYIAINYKNHILLDAYYSSFDGEQKNYGLPEGYVFGWFMTNARSYDVKATNRDYVEHNDKTNIRTWTLVSNNTDYRSDPLSGYDTYEFRAAIVKKGTTTLTDADFNYDIETNLSVKSKILISDAGAVLAGGTDSGVPAINVEVKDNLFTRLLAFFQTFFGWGQVIKVVSGSSIANKLATIFGGIPTIQVCETV